MAMSRLMQKRVAIRQAFAAEGKRPPARRQIRRWLEPIRRSITQMKRHEVDSVRGYAVTRLFHADNYGNVHEALEGFALFISRLMTGVDVTPFSKLARLLHSGVPVESTLIDDCASILHDIEREMIRIPRNVILDTARDTTIAIEFELLGLTK